MTLPASTEDLFTGVIERAGGIPALNYLVAAEGRETADWLFPDQRIIVEHKHLLTDHSNTKRFETDLSEWRGRFPPEAIPEKDAAEFGRGVLRLFRRPLGALLKKANRQIASTAELLGWEDFSGIVIIANQGLTSLPPKMVLAVIQQLLDREYSKVHGVLYLSDHYVLLMDDTERALIAEVFRDGAGQPLREFVWRLGQEYAVLLQEKGGPFELHDQTSDIKVLDGSRALPLQPAKPPARR